MPLVINTVSVNAKGAPSQAWWAAATLLFTMAVPSLGYIYGSGSMAAGLLLVAGTLIGFSLLAGAQWRTWRGGEGAFVTFGWMMVIVVMSSGVTVLLHGEVNAIRTLSSIVLFAIVAFAAMIGARAVDQMAILNVHRAVDTVFSVLILSGIAGVIHFSPFASRASKAVLFFNEPSHYSLSFAPFLMSVVVMSNNRKKILCLAFGLFLGIKLESLTLVSGIIIMALVTIKIKHLIMISPIIAVLIANLTLDYYTDRLDFSQDGTNYSTLVLLSGWERANLAVLETFGLGVGFQQFGIIGDQGEIAALIGSLFGSRLNVLDGGTVGAKFVGEFGLTGIFLVLSYLAAWTRLFLVLRAGGRSSDARFVLAASIFIMYGVDLFVRGVAYFSPSSFLFLGACLWLAADRARQRASRVGPTVDQ